MYGIKFLIVVSGQGKKFDFLQLVLAFGANIALFDLVKLKISRMSEKLNSQSAYLCKLTQFG